MCIYHITIHRHVSVPSATVNRVSYKNTNDTPKNAQNVYISPPDVTFNTLSAPWGRKMSSYVIIKSS
jgi:hypothetical protein